MDCDSIFYLVILKDKDPFLNSQNTNYKQCCALGGSHRFLVSFMKSNKCLGIGWMLFKSLKFLIKSGLWMFSKFLIKFGLGICLKALKKIFDQILSQDAF